MLQLSAYIILPLAGGWAENYFNAVRQKAIAHAGIISSIAISLACIFIAFMLIKMYYDMASDEQSGGFAGIRVWDILRPIVFLILTMSVGTWLSWIDSACTTVASSINYGLNASIEKTDEDISKKLDELEEITKMNDNELRQLAFEEAGYTDDIKKEKNDYINEILRANGTDVTVGKAGDVMYTPTVENNELIITGSGPGMKPYESARISLTEDVNDSVEMKKLKNDIVDYDKRQADAFKLYENSREIRKWTRWLKKGGNLIGDFFKWLFNIFFVIMMAFADIMLCLLAIFAPFACALSILSPWKSTFTTWLGGYIEVSLWKPIGAVIVWIVQTVKSAVGEAALSNINGINLSAMMQKTSLMATIGVEALIFAAGLIALFNVPAIANMVLALGKGGDQFTGAASGMMSGAAGGAASGAMTGAKKVGTVGWYTGKGAISGISQGKQSLFGAGSYIKAGAKRGFLKGIAKAK